MEIETHGVLSWRRQKKPGLKRAFLLEKLQPVVYWYHPCYTTSFSYVLTRICNNILNRTSWQSIKGLPLLYLDQRTDLPVALWSVAPRGSLVSLWSVALWSVEKVASFALSCWLDPPSLPFLWCQFKTSRAAGVLCHGLCWLHCWVAHIPHIPGHHPTLNLKHACGRGSVEPGCEAAVIFQSTYGVSVTFRVTPTWVKCMFWRTSPMADRHSSPREKRGRKSHLLWSRWVQSFFICLIQTGWMLQR